MISAPGTAQPQQPVGGRYKEIVRWPCKTIGAGGNLVDSCQGSGRIATIHNSGTGSLDLEAGQMDSMIHHSEGDSLVCAVYLGPKVFLRRRPGKGPS